MTPAERRAYLWTLKLADLRKILDEAGVDYSSADPRSKTSLIGRIMIHEQGNRERTGP